MSGVSYLPPESGDVLGIGTGIIRAGGRGGKLLEVTAAHAVAAFGICPAIRDGPVADGAADSLSALARFGRGFRSFELSVEVDLRGRNQFAQQGDTSRGRLLGAVVPERVGLALRFENEGSEPGRKIVRQIENGPR